ncbi:hypothetical protein G6652_09265 [Polynucleobacter paneuropaeus]|jgi:hypothetical protein|nr:hypothetical protein [Polynucleobacter paneuropaeus]MBT8617413.1 hypothetical protein [Polynucleobacter paneuropaeus]MBT8619295.1 hypothetical protein [Polynucleobacter paneuropaeus]MBT8621179.1 hypothetical protein [Polynucleobacter paneuropaeus]MBT8626710.1 hypothetical protein [Polynucleobacter paneuropaeus]
MTSFTRTGDKAYDYWLIDESATLGFIPGGIIATHENPIPIWLHVGNPAWGEAHIQGKHGNWLASNQSTVIALVYEKLSQKGSIYCSEDTNKIKISLRLTPTSIMILTLQQRPQLHFSITSIYPHPARIDGEVIGKYLGRILYA